MLKKFFLAILALVSLALPQDKKPQWGTEAEFRAFEPKILEMIERFYRQPLGQESVQDVRTISEWALLAPHIGFTVDKLYLRELDKGDAYYPLFASAYTLGEIDLKLRNRKEYSREEIAAASLAGMLKGYQAVLASEPKARRALLDRYLAMQTEGSLLEHFESMKSADSPGRGKEMPSHYDDFEFGIKVRSLEGEKVKLKDWKKKDVLFLYVLAGCPHCRQLAKTLKDSVKTKAEIVLLFSRINSPAQIQEFFEYTQVKFKAFQDFEAQFGKEYGGGIVPVALLVRKDGSATRVGGGKEKDIGDLIRDLNAL